jgi:hypothetical protein
LIENPSRKLQDFEVEVRKLTKIREFRLMHNGVNLDAQTFWELGGLQQIYLNEDPYTFTEDETAFWAHLEDVTSQARDVSATVGSAY